MYVITLHYTVQTLSLPNYQTCFAQGNECKISFRLSFTQLQSHTNTHTHISAAIACSFLYLPTPYSRHMILKAIMSCMVYINNPTN